MERTIYININPTKRIKIAINSLSVLGGGGVSNFLNLIPSLSKIDNCNEYIVFISDRQKEILDVIPDGFQKVIIDYGYPLDCRNHYI